MNFDDALNKLSIMSLIEYAKNISDLNNDLVYSSYSKLLNFSSSCVETKNENLLIGIAHMVYGWMPTMLEYREIIELDSFWENVKAGSLDINFLNMIKSSINNSIVGGSKFLHFLNPMEYAIFDSRVFSSITKSKSYEYNTNNVENYSKYIIKLRSMRNEANELKQYLIGKRLISHDIGLMRCMELCLFYNKN